MNIEQTNELLTKIQARDNRPLGDATVLAWHEDIGDLDYGMAYEAVRLHFRESEYPIRAAHVRAGVERILLAGLGTRQDEWGNDLEADAPALAAWRRLQQQKGISA